MGVQNLILLLSSIKMGDFSPEFCILEWKKCSDRVIFGKGEAIVSIAPSPLPPLPERATELCNCFVTDLFLFTASLRFF